MEKKSRRYWRAAVLGVLAASLYPLSMGARVIGEMIVNGTVAEENYPKYVIPYAPLCLALLAGVLLMPVLQKRWGRRAFGVGSLIAAAVFFAAELCFEKCVTVTGKGTFNVEGWQMVLCMVPRNEIVSTPIDLLVGQYHPAFKMHFYMISLVLLLSILRCLYGWPGQRRLLKLQAGCTLIFLGLCILACFTAFWRGAELLVSPLSAGLMTVFFLLLGATAGLYVASLGKGGRALPVLAACVCAAAMYAGEMILLGGELYRFGSGFFFRGLPGVVLAPVDAAIILGAGALTAGLLRLARE